MDNTMIQLLVVVMRVVMALTITTNGIHPDEYWQSIEPAYHYVYSDVTHVYLPWEWSEHFRLRNCIYPMYLTLPLRFVRFLGVDYNFIVRSLPYIAHLPIVLLTDFYTWAIAKRIVKKEAARLCMLMYFTNTFQTLYLIRTLTNTIEQMFAVVSFYYFLN